MTEPDPFQLHLHGHLAAAEAAFRERIARSPGDLRIRYGLGVNLLAQGRYAEAVDLYDLRFDMQPQPSTPWPRWKGEPLAGKRLAVFPEQGLGDQIAFARFAPGLQAAGADVTLLCAPSLERLFQTLGVRVVAASGRVEFPDPDFVAASSSLIRCAGSPADVPAPPYLMATPRTVPGARIGVTWRGNPLQHSDATRSLPPELGAELLALPGAISLDPEDTGARDLHDTAEIIAGLDLVISVCTSVAHLTGALGKPLWALLPDYDCDWRWMRGRSDSPWYPSARLFRQARSGDWRETVERVKAALAAEART